jgi:hypothetical protein
MVWIAESGSLTEVQPRNPFLLRVLRGLRAFVVALNPQSEIRNLKSSI